MSASKLLSTSIEFWVVPMFLLLSYPCRSCRLSPGPGVGSVCWCILVGLWGRWEHYVFALLREIPARATSVTIFWKGIVQTSPNCVVWRWRRIMSLLACRVFRRRSARGMLLLVGASSHGETLLKHCHRRVEYFFREGHSHVANMDEVPYHFWPVVQFNFVCGWI